MHAGTLEADASVDVVGPESLAVDPTSVSVIELLTKKVKVEGVFPDKSKAGLGDFITLAVDDESVATATVNSEGEIEITGVGTLRNVVKEG